MGDYQARFCERLKGKFLRPTRRFLRWVQVYDRAILKVDNNDVNLRLKT